VIGTAPSENLSNCGRRAASRRPPSAGQAAGSVTRRALTFLAHAWIGTAVSLHLSACDCDAPDLPWTLLVSVTDPDGTDLTSEASVRVFFEIQGGIELEIVGVEYLAERQVGAPLWAVRGPSGNYTGHYTIVAAVPGHETATRRVLVSRDACDGAGPTIVRLRSVPEAHPS
jgi:hypothetical protein